VLGKDPSHFWATEFRRKHLFAFEDATNVCIRKAHERRRIPRCGLRRSDGASDGGVERVLETKRYDPDFRRSIDGEDLFCTEGAVVRWIGMLGTDDETRTPVVLEGDRVEQDLPW